MLNLTKRSNIKDRQTNIRTKKKLTEKEKAKIVVINEMFTNLRSHLENEKSLLISLFLSKIISNFNKGVRKLTEKRVEKWDLRWVKLRNVIHILSFKLLKTYSREETLCQITKNDI